MELTDVRTRSKRIHLVAAVALTLALASGGLLVKTPDRAKALTVHNTPGAFTVSADAFRIQVTAIGETGESTGAGTGGLGAVVTATLPVTPNETLQIFVDEGGGTGGAGDGVIGQTGGAGGGASGVRRGTSPLVVAAGGGGAGGDALLAPVLQGGDGGSAPTGAGSCRPGGDGSAGLVMPVTTGFPGTGGQCATGGTGGEVGGTDGSSGAGGNGGSDLAAGSGGGGGGGGLFGGGGGGAGAVGVAGAGGGGAGSSFVGANATDITMTSNAAMATPSVVVTELAGTTECSDGVDNADPEDAIADANDPGCHTDGLPSNPASYNPSDNDEADPPITQCNDNQDNNDPEDTLVDEADPGCHTDGDANNALSYYPFDDSEINGVGTTECSDGIDNTDPEDTLADRNDPGCHTDGNAGNANSYNANDLSEVDGAPSPQCSDGIDNTDPEDTLADDDDPGCHEDGNANNPLSYNPFDNTEADAGSGSNGNGGAPFTDLVLTMTANKAQVKRGKVVGLTVRVRNEGPDNLARAEVVVQLTPRLAFKSVLGNGCSAPAPSSNEVVCIIGPIVPNGSISFTVEAKARRAGIAKPEAEAILLTGTDLARNDNKDREKIRIVGGTKKRRR